jgi:5-methylcytosine-specific restriction endonuclease McrA
MTYKSPSAKANNGARYRRLRDEFIATHGQKCHWCGQLTRRFTTPNDPLKTTIDHLIETDKKQIDPMDNRYWVIACMSCNSSRGAEYRNAKHEGRAIPTNFVTTSRPL